MMYTRVYICICTKQKASARAVLGDVLSHFQLRLCCTWNAYISTRKKDELCISQMYMLVTSQYHGSWTVAVEYYMAPNHTHRSYRKQGKERAQAGTLVPHQQHAKVTVYHGFLMRSLFCCAAPTQLRKTLTQCCYHFLNALISYVSERTSLLLIMREHCCEV